MSEEYNEQEQINDNNENQDEEEDDKNEPTENQLKPQKISYSNTQKQPSKFPEQFEDSSTQYKKKSPPTEQQPIHRTAPSLPFPNMMDTQQNNPASIPLDKEKLFETFLLFQNFIHMNQQITNNTAQNNMVNNSISFSNRIEANKEYGISPKNQSRTNINTFKKCSKKRNKERSAQHDTSINYDDDENIIEKENRDKKFMSYNQSKYHNISNEVDNEDNNIHNNNQDNSNENINNPNANNIEKTENIVSPKNNYDDIPIKASHTNFTELVEKTLAIDNGDNLAFNSDFHKRENSNVQIKPKAFKKNPALKKNMNLRASNAKNDKKMFSATAKVNPNLTIDDKKNTTKFRTGKNSGQGRRNTHDSIQNKSTDIINPNFMTEANNDNHNINQNNNNLRSMEFTEGSLQKMEKMEENDTDNKPNEVNINNNNEDKRNDETPIKNEDNNKDVIPPSPNIEDDELLNYNEDSNQETKPPKPTSLLRNNNNINDDNNNPKPINQQPLPLQQQLQYKPQSHLSTNPNQQEEENNKIDSQNKVNFIANTNITEQPPANNISNKEKEEALDKKIKQFHNEIAKVKEEKQKIAKLISEYERMQSKLHEEMTRFTSKKEDFERYKEEEFQKIQKEKKNTQNDIRQIVTLKSQVQSLTQQVKKDKDIIDGLKAQIVKLQNDNKAKDQTNKTIIDKLKKKIEDLLKKNQIIINNNNINDNSQNFNNNINFNANISNNIENRERIRDRFSNINNDEVRERGFSSNQKFIKSRTTEQFQQKMMENNNPYDKTISNSNVNSSNNRNNVNVATYKISSDQSKKYQKNKSTIKTTSTSVKQSLPLKSKGKFLTPVNKEVYNNCINNNKTVDNTNGNNNTNPNKVEFSPHFINKNKSNKIKDDTKKNPLTVNSNNCQMIKKNRNLKEDFFPNNAHDNIYEDNKSKTHSNISRPLSTVKFTNSPNKFGKKENTENNTHTNNTVGNTEGTTTFKNSYKQLKIADTNIKEDNDNDKYTTPNEQYNNPSQYDTENNVNNEPENNNTEKNTGEKGDTQVEQKNNQEKDSSPEQQKEGKMICDHFPKVKSNDADEMYDFVIPDKYHKNITYTLIKTISNNEKKTVNIYSNNKREIIFQSGVKKEIYGDGYQMVYFTNGDLKQIFPDHKSVYFFNDVKTVQTTYPNGIVVYKFNTGQIEKHFPDGTKQIAFPDGSIRYIYDGYEETHYADGTITKTDQNNVTSIERPDGTKDIIKNSTIESQEVESSNIKPENNEESENRGNNANANNNITNANNNNTNENINSEINNSNNNNN